MRLLRFLAALTFAASVTVTCTDTSGPARLPGAVIIVSGNNQSARAGRPLDSPLVVRVMDGQGEPLADQPVTFVVVQGAGQAGPALVMSDANGMAQTTWTLGQAPTSQQVRATVMVAGVPFDSVLFAASVLPEPVASVVVMQGSGQSALAGRQLPLPIVVQVRDSAGLPLRNRLLRFIVRGGGGTVEGLVHLTDSLGQASEAWTVGRAVGTVHLLEARAVSPAGDSLAAALIPASVVIGRLATLQKISGDSQAGYEFQPLPQPLKVRAFDSVGTPISGLRVAFVPLPGSGVTSPAETTLADGTASGTWTMGPAWTQQALEARALDSQGVILASQPFASRSVREAEIDSAQRALAALLSEPAVARRLATQAALYSSGGLSFAAAMGRTFVHDPALHTYVESPGRAGAPPSGVRMVLYDSLGPAQSETGVVDIERRIAGTDTTFSVNVVEQGATLIWYTGGGRGPSGSTDSARATGWLRSALGDSVPLLAEHVVSGLDKRGRLAMDFPALGQVANWFEGFPAIDPVDSAGATVVLPSTGTASVVTLFVRREWHENTVYRATMNGQPALVEAGLQTQLSGLYTLDLALSRDLLSPLRWVLRNP